MPLERPKPTIAVFDFGGVLIDWDPRYLYRKLFRDEAEMERFLAEVCTPDWNLEQDRGRDWDEAVRLLTERHPDKADLIAAYHLRWEETVRGRVPGTREVLADLRERGVRTFAITNFSAPKLKLAQRTYPEMTWFEGIVVSGEVGLVKPDPAIYHRLLDTYGLDAPDTVFIDDAPKNVDGARAVGMHAILFRDAAQLRRDLQELGLL